MTHFSKITELVRFNWFIKYMFRDKSDFEILEGFLSELFKEDITILQILESESNKTKKKDKSNRVDIMVKNSKEELIIVEVQNNDEYDYLQRILYGTSKTIVENIVQGEPYSLVKKILSVSVVYFRVGQGEDYIYHGTTAFKGIHLHDELVLSQEQIDLFGKHKPQELYPEYYLIKAGDFNENAINDTLDEWVFFLKTGTVKDDFKAKGIVKAKQKLEVAKLSKNKRAAYERDMKYARDEASWAYTQWAKEQFAAKREKERLEREQELVKKTALETALEKTIEIARSMKAENEPIEKIMKYTTFTQTELEKL